MEDKGVREAFHEMVREKNALKQKTQNTKRYQKNEDDSSDSDDFESGSEGENDEGNIRQKAISEIEKELNENEEDNSEEEKSESDEDEIKVNFKKKSSKTTKNTKEKQGLMGLKFMQRGEEQRKEQLKEKAQMVIDMIREEQNLLKENEEE